MACIYILFSESRLRFYVGSSREDSANARLNAHNAGKTRSIKNGRPWILMYEESLKTYTEARLRELFLKSGVGRKWINEQFGHYKKK